MNHWDYTTTKDDFWEGQEVVVIRSSLRSGKGPRKRDSGVITKIARKYLTIQTEGYRGRPDFMEFEIATRLERPKNPDYTNYLDRFATYASLAVEDREERAMKVWKDHNIGKTNHSRLNLSHDQIEAIACILDPTFVPGPQDPVSDPVPALDVDDITERGDLPVSDCGQAIGSRHHQPHAWHVTGLGVGEVAWCPGYFG